MSFRYSIILATWLSSVEMDKGRKIQIEVLSEAGARQDFRRKSCLEKEGILSSTTSPRSGGLHCLRFPGTCYNSSPRSDQPIWDCRNMSEKKNPVSFDDIIAAGMLPLQPPSSHICTHTPSRSKQE